MKEYNKIENLYKRDYQTKKLVVGNFANETVEFLKNNTRQFTEKVDGTNIRIVWDGYRVSFYGRTDNANIPAHLTNRLVELFGGESNEELFEQKFGKMQVILFGEGYGPKIQSGGGYRNDVDFILFDAMINDVYVNRKSVENIAEYFKLDIVPIVLEGTIQDGVNYVLNNEKSIIAKNGALMEGLVGRPKVEVLDRLGKRVIVKIKKRDY